MTGLALARVVQTCSACPSQWDAWTTDGRYLYLRYRHGVGTVEQFFEPGSSTPSPRTLGALLDAYPILSSFGEERIAEFDTGDRAGEIDLERFCELAGLVLPHGVEISDEPGPLYVIQLSPDPAAKRSSGVLRGFLDVVLDAAGNGPAVRAVERQQAPGEPETPA